MDWNTKYEWENVDIDGSFNLSGFVGGSGGSASMKSSISASTESSFKDCFKGSKYSFEGFESFPESYSKKVASVCSSEPFIGLKLGKRTYFENGYTHKKKKKISSVLNSGKKVISSSQNTMITRCQVEGCNLDLSSAKEYHRKHRVCESHSKCPKVIVAGFERRFCQQCSRFHDMTEFDEEKRSCRKRLSDHNARRRKPPQPVPLYFNSTSPYSSFCGAESVDVLAHTTGVQLSDALNLTTLARNRSMPSKVPRVEIFDQGYKESLSSNEYSVDIRRALSLLSNDTWGSLEPDHNPMHPNGPTMVQHGMPADPHGSPFSYWQPNQQSADPHIQIIKSSYENSFLFHPSG